MLSFVFKYLFMLPIMHFSFSSFYSYSSCDLHSNFCTYTNSSVPASLYQPVLGIVAVGYRAVGVLSVISHPDFLW